MYSRVDREKGFRISYAESQLAPEEVAALEARERRMQEEEAEEEARREERQRQLPLCWASGKFPLDMYGDG